jgi:3-hydroxyisobutyrate dehydrogenase/2-hydroxy-3-oxopropionate reductase
MARVAVIGLGAMGARIARRLVDAGNEVAVWNRTPEKAKELVRRGARAGATPAEAATNAGAVITMVSDPAALADVTEGADGVLRALGDDTTLIQMSTVGPASVARVASNLERGTLLDAPVLGSISEVKSGTLTVFAGGDDAVVSRWTPLLSTLGRVLHVGGVGAGSAAKLVANTTLFGVIGVLGEALALADRLGLSRDAAFDVLAATPIAAQAERRRAAIEAATYSPRYALSLARKDADLVAAAATDAELDLRLAAAARTWLHDAEDRGWGGLDYVAMLAGILGQDPATHGETQ